MAIGFTKCPQCQSDIRVGGKFCPRCGAALADRNCPQCRSAVQPEDRYCLACGTALTMPPAPGVARRSDAKASPPPLPITKPSPPSLPASALPNSSPTPAMAPPASSAAPVAGWRPRPGVALFWALLLPGAGQAYNGQPVKGFFLLLLTPLVLPWIYSVINAWSFTKRWPVAGRRKGGFSWVFLHILWSGAVGLLVLIGLTLGGVLT